MVIRLKGSKGYFDGGLGGGFELSTAMWEASREMAWQFETVERATRCADAWQRAGVLVPNPISIEIDYDEQVG